MSRRYIGALGAALFAMGLQSSAAPAPPQGFLIQFEWNSDDPLFGGLSAIEMSADGSGVTLLSDQGAYTTGKVVRGGDGQITNVTLQPFAKLKALGNDLLAPGRNDSEGLAIGPDGAAYVSFEGVARVLRYARLEGSAENLPSHPDFGRLQTNSALEALAIDAQGTLYTLPERSGAIDRDFPIYRLRGGVWDRTLSLPRKDGFLPVGADFGPDGRLYILLRQFHGLSGFSSQLIRAQVGKDALGPIEVLFESSIGFHDNLEGVSIWRDSAGALRASMIADNNFLPFISSGIVEYRLPD
jgi:hypothetical protein